MAQTHRVGSRGHHRSMTNRAGNDDPPPVSTDDRHRQIAEAAYYRALARGFAPGQEQEDWLAAEAEIDRLRRSH